MPLKSLTTSIKRHQRTFFLHVKASWFLALSGLPNMALGSGDIDYMAGIHQSIWEYSGSQLKCELIHPIPEYGIARFIQEAGEDLVFWINVYHHPHKKGNAELHEISPPWIHKEPEKLNITINVAPRDPPFLLNHNDSTWVLNTLERGRMARFNYDDWEENRYRLQVSLNPVNFHPPFRDFQRCRKKLLAYGFNQLRISEVHFDTDKFDIDDAAEKTLERVARYIAINPEIERVLIHGHTDSIATDRYNMSLSSKRAQSVSDFLNLKGIEKNKIHINYYGESKPKVNNITEQGRAINRRVEIELVKK